MITLIPGKRVNNGRKEEILSLLGTWKTLPSSITSSWNACDSTPCLWVGVECDNAQNLRSLNLSGYGISGEIGLEIGLLSRLQITDLSLNKFPWKYTLRVRKLYGFNSLNSSIPLSLSSWKNLSTLVLSENQLSGSIPPFLSDFEKLLVLQLGGNLLGGYIPKSLGAWKHPFIVLNLSTPGNIPTLMEVNVSNNDFTGPLSETLMYLLESSPSSFVGNPGLYVYSPASRGSSSNANSLFKPCDNQSRNQNSVSEVNIGLMMLSDL
ncbi:leucine-rich repeat receptor-like protein kinase PEPR1 [Ziziphus jujuba]|uniref:Leucine-rich repeat receptor-like protein kinase PEPR1 n=1 Tax=Ziziphus jujuba TaxID=326968 RepID=A0ABM3I1I3_ZIZJJ|nr:leucine-rich repeat receptor-like protein kinase PEPR1 [Ziziphus jujuba]